MLQSQHQIVSKTELRKRKCNWKALRLLFTHSLHKSVLSASSEPTRKMSTWNCWSHCDQFLLYKDEIYCTKMRSVKKKIKKNCKINDALQDYTFRWMSSLEKSLEVYQIMLQKYERLHSSLKFYYKLNVQQLLHHKPSDPTAFFFFFLICLTITTFTSTMFCKVQMLNLSTFLL